MKKQFILIFLIKWNILFTLIVFAIHAINSTVHEFPKFNCRGKFKIVANKHHGLKTTYDEKIGKKWKNMQSLNSDLDLEEIPLIAKKFKLHPD